MAKKPQALQPSSGSRHLTAPSPLEEQSLAVIEKALGGREALVAALSHAPKSRDLEYLLGLIGDPAQSKVPLGYLCAQGGVTPGELLSAWKSGEILRGHVLATQQIVAALPGVVADVLKKAAPYEDTCTGCQGTGTVVPEPTKKIPNPEPQPCPACLGTGRLLYEADLARAEIVLELAQLTSKGGGVNVLVDQRQAHFNASGGAAGGTLEALMSASDRILYGDDGASPFAPPATPAAEVVDGEVVPPADSEPAEGG